MLFFSILQIRVYASANQTQRGDTINCPVIISEIMADPAPQVYLPQVEYIEIFNRSAYLIVLAGWRLIIGNHEKVLPAASILPGEYLIICDAEADSAMCQYGKTLLIRQMPPVLNSGQVLILKAPSGEVIHTIEFSQSWYSSEKDEGGWSLEIIDPDNPCGRKENWSESTDRQGGTPGKQNSVLATNPDHQSPAFLRATLPSDSSIMLHFSESMNAGTLNSQLTYSVSYGLLHPALVCPVEPSFTTTLLKFPRAFDRGIKYTITLRDGPEDCTGNPLSANAFADFAIPENPVAFDVVFNEVLFSCPENTSEFIELKNRSDKVVDLSAFYLALADPATDNIKKLLAFDNHPFILFPGNYVVVTKNASGLPRTAMETDPRVVVEHAGMFTMADEGALVVLLDTTMHVIDKLYYDRLMHAAILSETKGVSLERIDPEKDTGIRENWHSASSTTGYSTPGYENSQMVRTSDALTVTVEPEVFSPDNDGFDDIATLHMQFQQPGWTGSVAIYDILGKCVKTLLSNSLLGTEEHLHWDGQYTDERPADIGIYIFYIKVFNPLGVSKDFKKVISLVRKNTR